MKYAILILAIMLAGCADWNKDLRENIKQDVEDARMG